MPSSKIAQRAAEIAKRDKAFFDSLIEFEKTGRMVSKERMNFTIDRSVADRFRRYCRREQKTMSAVVEKIMRDVVGKDDT